MIRSFLFLFIFSGVQMFAQYSNIAEADAFINPGKFKEAVTFIEQKVVSPLLSADEKYQLAFRLDLMNRIKIDFRKTETDILTYLSKYYPGVTPDMLRKWESSGALEMRMIDGERRYFNNAGPNLFRIDKEAKLVKEKIDGIPTDPLDTFLVNYIPKVLAKSGGKAGTYEPQRIVLNYKITLKPDVVPAGEVVRCWLPYPKEGYDRQKEVTLLGVNSSVYVIAPDSVAHRTLYMEKRTEAGKPLEFSMQVSYLALAQMGAVSPGNEGNPLDWLGERPPHIVFTDEIKKRADELTKDVQSKYEQAKRIYDWIDNTIPWASALEYSTLPNISGYCLSRLHGDCGIKTLLFMTMCRYKGIPARWQSGWMLEPGSVNLHDWCTIYIEGKGWIPVDQSFGKQIAEELNHRYFFFGNTDAYHLIVNDDYGQPLFPAKIYTRSETVDFQRGELEWRGGNIYFNDWNYSMKVDYLSVSEK